MIPIIGLKIGMSSYFSKNGNSIPITIIKIYNNRIIEIKEFNKKNIYVKITNGFKRKKYINKSILGYYIKNNLKPGLCIKEFKIKKNNYFIEKEINIKFLKKIKKVSITSKSKGKGFSGTVKRWNFKTQDSTHGNSLSHRVPGSIGQNQSPGRVFKGKKMAGQLGNKRITIKNLEIIKIILKHKIILIKGSIPGPSGKNVIINPIL